uniref:Uncharacterized protein n=1 Tax=Meloidogyne hapla TaxID=6305 RepID=A0A1I8C3N0_MELHA
MSESLQSSINDLSTLCSCSTNLTFEDCLNRVKLLELTINSTKQNFSANNDNSQKGFSTKFENQTIILQLQEKIKELTEKMNENVNN